MERYYEENEEKVWSEEDIRKELFKGVVDKLREDAKYYFSESDSLSTLDCDYQLLQLALKGKIEDVIEELTNVRNYNFVNVDNIIDSEKFTNNIDNLKKAIEFFGKYYRACKGVYGLFEYQGIERKDLDNLEDLTNELTSVDYTLEKMEREYE